MINETDSRDPSKNGKRHLEETEIGGFAHLGGGRGLSLWSFTQVVLNPGNSLLRHIRDPRIVRAGQRKGAKALRTAAWAFLLEG